MSRNQSRNQGIYVSRKGSVVVEGGSVKGGPYGDGIYAYLDSNVTVSGGSVTGLRGIYAGLSDVIVSGGAIEGENSGIFAAGGNIIVSGGTVTGNDSPYGLPPAAIHAHGVNNITLSGGEVRGKARGVLVRASPTSFTTLTLSGDAKILPVGDNNSSFTKGAIVFQDEISEGETSSRDILNLASNPDNIQGLVWSFFQDMDTSESQLQNTKILTLSGERSQSLKLAEFGTIGSSLDSSDAIMDGDDNIKLSDATKAKGRKFFAFDTIIKEGTGTWTLSGELTKGIIKAGEWRLDFLGYIGSTGLFSGIQVKEGTLAIAPDAIVNVESLKEGNKIKVPGIQVAGGTLELGANTQINSDIVADKAGTLYAKPGVQNVDSLVINGTYKMDIRSVNDYSQLHSKDTVVIAPDAKLAINATLTEGGDEAFTNIITSDVAINGIFKQENVTV